jgi:RHS repeat-associated protein
MNGQTMILQRLTATMVASIFTLPLLAADPPAKAPRAEATTDATSWSSGAYQYDGAGNIKNIGTDVYRYDEHGRLTSAEAETQASPVNRQEFTYDRYGNVLTVTTRKIGPTGTPITEVATYAVNDETNQLTDWTKCPPGTVTCRMARYDARGSGNQTGYMQDNELQWDALGMMTELDSHRGDRHERYIYDANDERIVVVAKDAHGVETERRFSVRGVDTKVSRELVFFPTTNTWTPPKDYVYRGGALIASYSGTNGGPKPDLHYHSDHLGSTRLITDTTGQRLAVHTYWPFGQEAPGSDVNNERMKFTGHERDGSVATGGLELDYMHARYYDATLRFLSVDPVLDLKRTLPEPQRWNRYSYVVNNPINRIDPDGRMDGNGLGEPVGWRCPGCTRAEAIEQSNQIAKGTAIGAAVSLAIMAGPSGWRALGGAAMNWIRGNPGAAQNIANAVLSPPGSSALPANPISGEVLREVSTSKGAVGILANASSSGTVLTLKDAAVYPMKAGSLANQVGPRQLLEGLRQLGAEAKAAGYTKLIVEGVRATGANPGKTARYVLDLEKLK